MFRIGKICWYQTPIYILPHDNVPEMGTKYSVVLKKEKKKKKSKTENKGGWHGESM